MKKVTATITTTNVIADFYNLTTEQIERFTVVKRGEDVTSLDYRELPNYVTCKIVEKSSPTTAKYSMTLDEFISKATESDIYKHGFLNRTVGGEVVTVLVFDNDSNSNIEVDYPKSSERELRKLCEADNSIYIKTLATRKVDEKFYYMSYEDFTQVATVVIDEK